MVRSRLNPAPSTATSPTSPNCSPLPDNRMFLKFSSRFFALALLATSSVQAQDGMDHSMHMNHNMPMGDSLAWRMVPMGDLSMPMMPGMMDDYPEVGPMLPGHGMDISMFSEARPSEIIDIG